MTQERSTQKASTTNYYKLLGVKPTASEFDIRQAYRKKSKLYHPDTTSLPPTIAAEKFEQLKEAYRILTNPDIKQRGDRSQVTRRPSPAPASVSTTNLDPKQRPLSAGEVFALFLLGVTFTACLVLALVVGTTQSEGWRTHPPQWATPLIDWLDQHSPTAPAAHPENEIVKGVSFSAFELAPSYSTELEQ